MKRLHPESVWFTVLLGALVTFASFATDMGLPVLAEIGASLGVSAATAALTMSLFMAGFALGPLVMAPVSDRHGRRPLLLMGCAIFAVCGALGASARTLPALLAWRFLMGVGAGTAQVLVVATVRDLFSGSEARVRQSYVNLAAGLAPIIAPTLGVYIAAAGGWRAIYWVLAGAGAAGFLLVTLLLRESAPLASRTVLTVRGTLSSYLRVARHPVSMGYALVVALCFGCLFSYVSGSSLVLIGLMGVGQHTYGLLFAITALGLVAGALGNARLNRIGIPHRRLVTVSLIGITGLAFLALALSASHRLGVVGLVSIVVVSHVGQAIVRANAAQGALEPMPEIAGVASAVITGLQMIAGAVASAAAASLFDGHSANAMTGTMSIFALAALGVYFLVVRPAEDQHARIDRRVAEL